jgi:hypothetical protein
MVAGALDGPTLCLVRELEPTERLQKLDPARKLDPEWKEENPRLSRDFNRDDWI